MDEKGRTLEDNSALVAKLAGMTQGENSFLSKLIFSLDKTSDLYKYNFSAILSSQGNTHNCLRHYLLGSS